MKKIISKILLATVCSSMVLMSCDIERLPNGSMAAEDITSDPLTALDGLLGGSYAQLKTWSDPMHRLGEYSGDNMMIRKYSSDDFFSFISFSRTPDNDRLLTFWDYGYKAVAQASNIMKMIEEGQSEEIDSKLGECYYIRGMMYFYLARAFSRPYYQAPDKNLGIPIVNGTPDDMNNVQLPDRSTVATTYQQAIADLKKAESMINVNNGPIFASVGAAQAMLSRVYLYMSGTYSNPNTQYADSAAYYATQVINSGAYELLPREDFMAYNTFVPENNPESIFCIKRVASEFSGYDHYYGVGGMYGVIGGMGWGEMFASAKYIDLLNETGRNDWRPDHKKIVDARANFIEPQYVVDSDGNYTKVFRFINDIYNNGTQSGYYYQQFKMTGNNTCTDGTASYTLTPDSDPNRAAEEYYTIQYNGKTYTGVVDYEISLNNGHPKFYIVKCSREGEDSHLHSPVISRLGEIYLNRAEANAKLGRYGEALNDLNTIRERSIPGEGYASLDVTTAPSLIDKERQLELAFQAERSYDVFRNGGTLTRHFPGAHNAMEEVTATDFRVTYYIPQKAIDAYPNGNTLTQNPLDNSGVILN
ncbi:RagB/SusD family nutrient uptake outer membrane protein [uncultured Parabacteroides sp.]|uniref:RagB/SusD family nutrient uptake outer membrane protein n=1 Tax=uncultured Parabacteroides sp. TaxID=512312 RepID=UPI0028041479|nr:RagB/SusD family nutrient uptake outer membrane protein [uncultured Parabacteroides sp.]